MTGTDRGEIRILGSVLAVASQEKLARIVAMVDGLEDRKAADQVLDRARPRLRNLGLPRPLRLARILFLPMDGLVVAPGDWRPYAPTLPRSALAPLADSVRAALGEEAIRLERMCEGRTLADADAAAAIGASLWPAAARALPAAAPPGWAAAGLPERVHGSIAARCAAAWRHGAALWPAVRDGAAGPPEATLRAALKGPAEEGGIALDTAMRAILARAARPATVTAVAAGLVPDQTSPAARAIQQAFDEHIVTCDPAAGLDHLARDSATAMAMARAACDMIEDLEASPLANQPHRRERLRELRRTADAACRRRFAALLRAELLEGGTARAAAAAEDTAASAIQAEEAARRLANLAASGRRLGGAGSYDAALRSATLRLARQPPAQGGEPTRADLLRLAEILVGPDAALEMVG